MPLAHPEAQRRPHTPTPILGTQVPCTALPPSPAPESAQDSQERDWHASAAFQSGGCASTLAEGTKAPASAQQGEQANAWRGGPRGRVGQGPARDEVASWSGRPCWGNQGGPAWTTPPRPPPAGARPGMEHACVEVPPRQPMPGTGPVLPGDEQILSRGQRDLINQKLDNGGNTLIIFFPAFSGEICLHSAAREVTEGVRGGPAPEGEPRTHTCRPRLGGHSEGPRKQGGQVGRPEACTHLRSAGR